MKYAAERGHLECVKYAVNEGCEFGDVNEGPCAVAAKHGQLPTLQWLRAHGCAWDFLCPV